jgi:tetratricopeptide (TPR) repeat protein
MTFRPTRSAKTSNCVRFIAAAIAAGFLTGCAVSGKPVSGAPTSGVTADQLLNESPLDTGAPLPDLSTIDVLELTPGMRVFLDRNVGDERNAHVSLRKLLYAVVGGGQFDLVYDESTRTAEETFREQRGNCLSFTNMFIAMARDVGLKARYQEVDIPPIWSSVGGSLLLSQHVNVLIELDQNSERVVDFNMSEFDFDYDRRVITDQRARAHYFSNIGVEHMLAGNTDDAFANLRQSLLEDAHFGPAWVNLGILYRREGFPDHAEAAFSNALALDDIDLVAMSNLASLYDELGRTEQAAEFRDKVKWHRMRNPYYRYQQAQMDFENGEYEAAIANLEFAIRRRDNEDRFYALMSMSFLMSGDTVKAREWMERAREVAVENVDKRRYGRKLELLMTTPDDN